MNQKELIAEIKTMDPIEKYLEFVIVRLIRTLNNVLLPEFYDKSNIVLNLYRL